MKEKIFFVLLSFVLSSCFGFSAENNFSTSNAQSTSNNSNKEETMKIKVSDGKNEIIFELNDTVQSKSLYAQLPLEIKVSNYSSNEKIFYPPQKLPQQNGIEDSGNEGVLAYFSPWGNVVMFYGKFSRYSGLFILGNAISGKENIKNLNGKISVLKFE